MFNIWTINYSAWTSNGLLNWLNSYYDMENWTDLHWSNNMTLSWTSAIIGRVWNAQDFDWVNDYWLASNWLAGWDYSVSIWIKLDVVGRTHPVITNGSGHNMQAIYINSSWYVSQSYWIGTGSSTWAWTIQLLPNQWYNIVSTRNGSDGRVYINGVLDANWTVTTNTYTDNWAFWWQVVYNHLYINWIMDEVGIWNKSLSPTEVTALYNSWAWLSYDNFTS